MIYAYRTDIGLRESNQDCFYVPKDGNKPFVAVADGMGGHLSGNVASLIATDSVRDYIEAESGNPRKTLLLQHAMNHANAKVFEASKTEGCEGMGTTLVMAYLEEKSFYYANVGDSRLYHFNGTELKQLTEDTDGNNYRRAGGKTPHAQHTDPCARYRTISESGCILRQMGKRGCSHVFDRRTSRMRTQKGDHMGIERGKGSV